MIFIYDCCEQQLAAIKENNCKILVQGTTFALPMHNDWNLYAAPRSFIRTGLFCGHKKTGATCVTPAL